MQGRTLVHLKRNADLISTTSDIIVSDDNFLNLCRKIFVHHYGPTYDKLELSLYQTEPYKHPQHQNIMVNPHFVRDDGCCIYLQLVKNDIYLKMVQEEIIHVCMDILKINHGLLFTIKLDPNFDTNNLQNLEQIDISKCYSSISEKRITYSSAVAEKYISSFNSNKRSKPSGNADATNGNQGPIQGFNRNDWVSASKTRNYALKDTLIDWLDCCFDKSTEKKHFQTSTRSESKEYDFGSFIMNKGKQFEASVINLIKKKVKPTEFVTVCHSMANYDQRILEYEQMTIDEMMKGTPIIYQAVVMNRNGPVAYSYGMPDLLVRSDYLGKLMELDPLEVVQRTHAAPKLTGNYHYVVVDIKFTTLELCADGLRIRNSGSVPAYKCQLYIYNHAIGKIQGYEPPSSYILGRKYKYEQKGTFYSGNSCFNRFGHINYDDWDNGYIDETIAAIKWIKRLRCHGQEWTLLPKPSISELYPNMSSASDTPWDNLKKQFANQIGEISLLWNCGVKNRQFAHENGIFSIHDDKCNAEAVGINGPKQKPVLDKIIEINHKRKFENVLDRISMTINRAIDNEWMESYKLRISVDFETINNVFDDFSMLPAAQSNDYLFMIGVAYKVKSKPIEYKMFMISELSKDAEFQIIYQFYKYLRTITDKHLGKGMPIPSLYHWGHIERSFFSGLCDRLKNKIGSDIDEDIRLMKTNLNWYDLSECFKNNPIVINGCFKFGLKEIAGRLAELGLIKSKWTNKSACSNGNTAMIIAQKAYQNAKNSNVSIMQNSMIKEITAYNKIDCLVIHEIIHAMKKKAISQGLMRDTCLSDDDAAEPIVKRKRMR